MKKSKKHVKCLQKYSLIEKCFMKTDIFSNCIAINFRPKHMNQTLKNSHKHFES